MQVSRAAPTPSPPRLSAPLTPARQLVLPFVADAPHGRRASAARISEAHGSTLPARKAWQRSMDWTQTLDGLARSTRRLQREVQRPSARPDVDALLGPIERALLVERAAWALLVPDVATDGVPARVSDGDGARPEGISYDARTAEVRVRAPQTSPTSPAKVIGLVHRQEAGGYEGRITVTLKGSALAAVLERMRMIHELGG